MVMAYPCWALMAAAATESDPSPQRKQPHQRSRSYGGSGLTTVHSSAAIWIIRCRPRVSTPSAASSGGDGHGARRSGGRTGYIPTAWMPDARRYGETNWLELDYATPMKAERMLIYHNATAASRRDHYSDRQLGTNLTRLGHVRRNFRFPRAG